MKTFPLIATIIMALSLSSFAQQPPQARGSKPERPAHAKKEMPIANLTADQEKAIGQLRLSLKKDMLMLRADARTKEAALDQLQIGDNVDQARVNRAIEELSTVKVRMAINKAEHRQKVRKLLTEEQRIEFDAMACQRKQKQHKEGKRMHQHRPDMQPAPMPQDR